MTKIMKMRMMMMMMIMIMMMINTVNAYIYFTKNNGMMAIIHSRVVRALLSMSKVHLATLMVMGVSVA